MYPVIGNHDYVTQNNRKAYLEAFPLRLNYYFHHHGWQFIGLDTTEGLRYEKTTIALVLGETGEKEAVMAIEKLRKLLSDVKLSDEIVPFSAGLAEAVVRQQFDPVDIVTEVINRDDRQIASAFRPYGPLPSHRS